MTEKRGSSGESNGSFQKGKKKRALKRPGGAKPRSADRAGGPGTPSRKNRRDAEPAESGPNAAAAGPGPSAAHAIIIDRIGDKGLVVHFENGPGVPLAEQRVLYQLLLALCMPTSCFNQPCDGLVPFKTAEELAARLGAEGGAITLHCLSQRLSRLWTILRHCQHGHLIESDRSGYRVRLLQGGQVVDRSAGEGPEDE
jgi:hypothetical protein